MKYRRHSGLCFLLMMNFLNMILMNYKLTIKILVAMFLIGELKAQGIGLGIGMPYYRATSGSKGLFLFQSDIGFMRYYANNRISLDAGLAFPLLSVIKVYGINGVLTKLEVTFCHKLKRYNNSIIAIEGGPGLNVFWKRDISPRKTSNALVSESTILSMKIGGRFSNCFNKKLIGHLCPYTILGFSGGKAPSTNLLAFIMFGIRLQMELNIAQHDLEYYTK
jgi:hypothetical protein